MKIKKLVWSNLGLYIAVLLLGYTLGVATMQVLYVVKDQATFKTMQKQLEETTARAMRNEVELRTQELIAK